jgi:hypothetical protein
MADRAMYDRAMKSYKNKVRATMSYNIRIPYRRIESIFGTAYPSLKLSVSQKRQFLTQIIAQRHNIASGDGYSGLSHDVRVGFIEAKNEYDVEINIAKRQGYDIALSIERWVYTTPRLKTLSPPRFWNRIFTSGRPIDSYLIPDLNIGDIMVWLEENAVPKDYQIYSKFGRDYSIGFKNLELSTMFKLHFGDKDA